MSLNVRMYTWLQGQLSWSYVMSRLGQAFDNLGHNTYFCSTNGLKDTDKYFSEEKMIESVLGLQNFGPGKKPIHIDVCYTVPQNFPKRFLQNSINKCAIYNFETTYWNPQWHKFYHLADYYFPSSNFSAEVFCLNGIPPEKVFVIPHGVDTSVFNPDISPVKLRTKKKFKFVSVVAPHYRKNINTMLEAYCEAFTSKDDVCLVLKTKIYKHSDKKFHITDNPGGRKPFEIILGDIFKKLHKRFGKDIPEIEVLSGHVENVSSIYNACDCHITTTGSEGFGMPMLESMACGLINVAPNYSGQLDFMNEDNSLLIDTSMRYAKVVEQYWTYNAKSKIGQPSKQHTVELMRKVVSEHEELLKRFKPEMQSVVDKFSWEYAANLIIRATQGDLEHYVPGTYKFPA